MNAKKFLISGIVGGIVDFILGGLFYQTLFPNIYHPNKDMKVEFIALGCLTFGLFVSYIFVKWANITTFKTGLFGGAVIGFFYGLSMDFFMYSGMPMNFQNFVTDVLINVIMGSFVGAAISLVNGKL
ncbi:hypothetical protein [Flavobacterium psychrotolerans]|uniref:DUF1761 domain-containing protein n=1 Tax=Flavobacterium psychrotolerans TaxID=2169410 RepID=A0A2U1JQA6_9FLAO|nr:hypothetical protein [Flavobacterium psychrotolerans]PWA07366.1 hypothetical protein DB895_01205 [Flavobacterium psychrotolerans]